MSGKKKKGKKPKKTKQQKDEERKQRESQRARRDAERAKKRLELRAKIFDHKQTVKLQQKEPQTPQTTANVEKEHRKKILKYRRAQSRFALPKISPNDNLEDIVKANAELEASMTTDTTDTIEAVVTNDNDTDSKEQSTVINVESDVQSVKSFQSFQSVEELTLSNEQEYALNNLQTALESADPDYYGFVDYNKFMSILKSNQIKLSAKHETFLMGALTLIDEGVDYYDFSRKIREVGMTLQPDNTLQDICEEIAETVEKAQQKKKKEEDELPSTNLDEMSSKDIVDVDQKEFEAFFEKAKSYRGRGMSLARMKSASADVNKSTKLGELIDDLALDGAEIDFALFKTALSTIDCSPPDKDLKYLINHLCEDGTGFVDFNYLITFLQQTSGVPIQKWTRIEKIISKVVNQLKMVERADMRRQAQETKLKERLQKKRNTRLAKANSNDEMAQLVAEEKRLRALKLRDKAKNVTKKV